MLSAEVRDARKLSRKRSGYIDEDDLRSVAQTALLEAFISFDAARGSQFGTWAKVCVRRQLRQTVAYEVEHNRLYALAGPGELEREDFYRDDPNPEEAIVRADLTVWLRLTVAELPPRRSAILNLRAFGETHQEIAETMGVCRVRVCQEETAAKKTIRDRAVLEGLDLRD